MVSEIKITHLMSHPIPDNEKESIDLYKINSSGIVLYQIMFEDNNLISSGLTGRDTYVAIMGSGKRIPEAFRDALTEKYEINGSKVDIVEFELDCLMEYEDEFDYITQITGSMQDNAHYSQIATSDIMLAPIRGGAFEFQVLEALIMGKTVVLSTKGGWSEIPLKNDVYWIESGNRTFPMITDYKGSTYHYGNIYQVDVEKTVTALEQALNKPKVPDKNYYIRNYSPKAYAEKLIRFFPLLKLLIPEIQKLHL